MQPLRTRDLSQWSIFKDTPWYSFYEKDNWSVVGMSGGRSGAGVLVIDSLDRVLLVKSYRIALDMECLELPRGFSDNDEDHASCAIRECEEETGVRVGRDDLIDLGVVHPDSGILSSCIGLFAARLKQPFGDVKPDFTEIAGYALVDWDDLGEMISDGRVNDAFTICAYMRLSRLQKA